MRLELTRRNRHYPLKVACIPISPPAQKISCTQNRTRTCTALRPLVPETSVSTNSTIWAFFQNLKFSRLKKRNTLVSPCSLLSERRDSNPRPRPWQGRALPTELLSHKSTRKVQFSNCPTKIYSFLKTCNMFFRKKIIILQKTSFYCTFAHRN